MTGDAGRVPAPGLLEVAGAWWDVDREPVVSWDSDARIFWLTDGLDDALRLHLVTFASPRRDASTVASVLAEGLAGCDFPPTADGADPKIVAATLRAAGIAT